MAQCNERSMELIQQMAIGCAPALLTALAPRDKELTDEQAVELVKRTLRICGRVVEGGIVSLLSPE